jgi:hypothetical protein
MAMEVAQVIPDDRVFDEYPVPNSSDSSFGGGKTPASQEVMAALLQSSLHGGFDNKSEFIKESQDFNQISLMELQGFLDWMSSQSEMYNFVIIGKGEQESPVSMKDITLSPSKLAHGEERSLEESWVMVPSDDLLASQFIHSHPGLQQKSAFFAEWPSFGVYDKVGWLLSKTGTGFCWGYLIGAKAALDSLYSLTRHPAVAGGVGLAAGYAAFVSPQLILRALQYVVIGGAFGGAAVAAPILVIGSTGIFVTASLYHAYQLSKRAIQTAIKSPIKPAPLALKQ